MWHEHPDNLQYAIYLESAQNLGGNPKQAMITVQQMRRLTPPDGNDPRIDLREAAVHESEGDYKQEIALAEKAAAGAYVRHQTLVVADAREFECWAQYLLQEFEAAEKSCNEAEKTYVDSGQDWGVATVMDTIAGIRKQTGKEAEAEKLYQQALAIYRRLGNMEGTSAVLTNYSELLEYRGDLKEALRVLEEAAATKSAIADESGMLSTLDNLGIVYYELGNLDKATAMARRALAGSERSGDKDTQAYSNSQLGDIALQKAAFKQARFHYEKAFAIREQMGDSENATENRLALAVLSSEEGHPQGVADVVKDAVPVYQKSQSQDGEIRAHVIAANALLQMGRVADAEGELHLAQKLTPNSKHISTLYEVRLCEARVRLAKGQRSEAQELMTSLLSDAKRTGFVPFQFEAELLRARANIASDPRGSRASLAALERRAHAAGFELIAQKAGAERKKVPAN